AVHNLFVFDNLYSYVYFFAILAFIDSQTGRPIAKIEEAPELSPEDGMTYVLPVAAACAFILVWTVNIPGMQAAGKLITALSPSPKGIETNLSVFEDLTKHPSFAGQEIREQIVSFASTVIQSSEATNDQKQRAATLAVTEMQKQVASYPQDARERLQLSYVYRTIGDTESALKEVEAASKLSPKKESIWTEMGVAHWDAGDVKAAASDFNTAYALGPQFTDLAAYAAAGAIATGDTAGADKILLTAFGTTTVDNNILAVAYYRTKDWPRLINVWKLRASAPSATVNTWFSLAAAYYAAGDKANTIKTINEAVARYPEAAASGKAAIEQVQNNTVK
ncbi:MAG: hypothetical protein NTV60_01715, partial [Candidatus Kaiserbacteria bacterium]|nr:hypothetical protein [Candidatus Kaiserbacteria bacterium]